jgi:hypothetical protein
MKMTESHIKRIVGRVLNESYNSSGGYEDDYYYWKSEQMKLVLNILEEIQEAERDAPGGDTEDLQPIIDELEGLLDAVEVLIEDVPPQTGRGL